MRIWIPFSVRLATLYALLGVLLLALSMAACGGAQPAPTPAASPATPTEEANPPTATVAEPASNAPLTATVPLTATLPTPVFTITVVPLTPGVEMTTTTVPLTATLPTPVFTITVEPRTPGTPPISRTATVTPATADCQEPLDPNETAIFEQAPGLGCPESAPASTYSAHQPFHNGRMVWRQDNATIYVLASDGSWRSFPDTFADGDPESDPAIPVPPDVYQPVRGFGKVWREELGGAEAEIGWATAPERGSDASIQVWSGGLVISYGISDRMALLDDGTWRTIE